MLPYSRVRFVGIELRHGPKILDAHLFNATAFVVFQHLAAAPTLLNGAGDRRIDRNRVSLDLDNDAVPLDVEWTPAALRIRAIHADGIGPILVSNATHNHEVARLEALRGCDLEFA